MVAYLKAPILLIYYPVFTLEFCERVVYMPLISLFAAEQMLYAFSVVRLNHLNFLPRQPLIDNLVIASHSLLFFNNNFFFGFKPRRLLSFSENQKSSDTNPLPYNSRQARASRHSYCGMCPLQYKYNSVNSILKPYTCSCYIARLVKNQITDY